MVIPFSVSSFGVYSYNFLRICQVLAKKQNTNKQTNKIVVQKAWGKENLKWLDRSSCPEVFCKKGLLRNLAKFTGKYLRQRLFFNKVAGLTHATLLKRSHWHKFCEIS